jgi:uncharacterized OB-fold protein
MPIPHPDLEFDRFLLEGRILLQRSRASGRFFFPPRVAEPATGSDDLEWAEVSGRATIYAMTTVYQKPPAQDRTLALVALEEGPRLLTRLECAHAASLCIGDAVRARIDVVSGRPILVFVAADDGAFPARKVSA